MRLIDSSTLTWDSQDSKWYPKDLCLTARLLSSNGHLVTVLYQTSTEGGRATRWYLFTV